MYHIIYTYIYVYNMYVSNIYTYMIHTYKHTYIHTHTHTYIHTYISVSRISHAPHVGGSYSRYLLCALFAMPPTSVSPISISLI